MSFNSLLFFLIFLPLFLGVFYIVPKKYRYIVLLIFSIIFYLYSGVFNLCLIIILSLINFFGVLITSKYIHKNFCYYILVIINVSVLLFFKYGNSLIFPLGISFYIFNSISYIIDVKNKKFNYEGNYLYYLTYIMLFTHVTMGPIIKYSFIKDSIKNLSASFDDITLGFKRFLRGLFKKVIIADNLGVLYSSMIQANANSVLYFLCLIVFALQLYIDFSSYMDMIIGIGKMIGIDYPENFNYPYLSLSISDFWRRWHITLSNFFKDYVYFPMGGSRVKKFRLVINILTVWILTGVWHGNTINYLFWGLYYGIIIVFEKLWFDKILKKLPNFVKHIYVICILLIGYIFFSVTDINLIIKYFKVLFSFTYNKNVLFFIKENIILLIFSIILCFNVPKKLNKLLDNKVFIIIQNIFYVALYFLTITYVLSGSFLPFLYNNF